MIECVDDSNRPNAIPFTKWVKKGCMYTPIGILKCNIQGGILGYKLAEIDLDASCEPYKCFSINRFKIPVEDEIKEEELSLEYI